ncbi:cytochrome c oxidase accessory protein CcoG [Vulgatibacter incomptus]|uniref:Type cbb3 cytochrome oxidase biogenesis protein CcoG, involved in Cu oxidation n=1 Tax=Vulgatibacter incomptus TaxID=1391653 RepID=A0A0K1PHJ9_9BACT|nr:cytochrome c oxidase accessory protein CcoG [Vulgatibacter incomptus]AKU92987.1 Type cbb3 cytochrome oxidase biogenesis protein CcoG, involved in Cu oxidation [Vulgatibacter incomptus]
MATREKPSLQRLSSIHKDGSRNHVHPADVKGRFVRRRTVAYAALIAIYLALPFVRIGGAPAVFLDVAGRRFFLFGATFNAQDFWLVVFLLAAIGFSLLFFTAWLGRVWCGWACPQTVFLEGVYRRIERWIEGPREARIRLASAPWSPGKIARKVLKHAAFVVVSLLLSHAFLSFFVSLGSLVEIVQRDPRENPAAFLWTMAVAGALYFNFAWFREQLCIVICPYGRLQSAMQDDHSLVIGYDVGRGEPRGKIRREERHPLPVVSGEPLPKAPAEKGDCVDCNRCVVVCPTGIDIRDGLQLECIGCAQCVDACDDVMIKIGRPTGLIRYDSQAGLTGQPKRTFRPRLVAYGALLLVACTSLALGLSRRTPFEANLLRVRGAPFVLTDDAVRNQFELHLVNKNPGPTDLMVEVSAPLEASFTLPHHKVHLESLESFRLPIFVSVPREGFPGAFEVRIDVEDGASGKRRAIEARFLGPAPSHKEGT